MKNLKNKITRAIFCSAIVSLAPLSSHAQESSRPLSMFLKANSNRPCYDREKLLNTSAVDAHLHAYPFGGKSAL